MAETQAAPEPTFREQVEQAQPEPVEQAAPEPVEQAQEQPEPVAEEKVEKVVPLAALHEERRRRQEYQRAADESQRNFIALQRQQAEILAELQRRANPPPAPIDPQTDPLGAMVQQQQLTQAQITALRQDMYARQQQDAQTQQVTQIERSVNAQEAAFTARQPDYYQAIEHLRGIKTREYMAAGMDENGAAQAVARDAWQLSQACLQSGQSPAERAYEIAKALGYHPAAKAEDKVAMQQAGLRASTPSGGAGAGNGRVSLDQLLKMDQTSFLEATKGDKWRKLMGG